ncbi:MAG: GerAB/ArcD/ProY family transporter [Bacillota bacterium]
MQEEGKFGLAEAVVLLTMSNMARIFMTFPRGIIELAGPAAWLTPLPGLMLALLGVYIFWLLLKPHPDKTIVEITESALGPVFGTAINVIYVIFFLFVGMTFSRIFSEALLVSILPRTPISAVNTGFVLTALLGSYLGVEVLARSARVTYPFVLGGIIVLLVSLYPFYRPGFLFPMLGTGPYQVFVQGGFDTGVVSEVLIAAVIVHCLASRDLFTTAVSRAMLMGFAYLIILELAIIMDINWRASSENTLPFYTLTRGIYLGRFFQRIEAIFVIIWGFIGMIKVSITLYAASVTLARALKLPYYRPLIWPLGLIIFIISLLPPDLPTTALIDSEYLRPFGWFPTFLLPLVVLAVDRFRARRRES